MEKQEELFDNRNEFIIKSTLDLSQNSDQEQKFQQISSKIKEQDDGSSYFETKYNYDKQLYQTHNIQEKHQLLNFVNDEEQKSDQSLQNELKNLQNDLNQENNAIQNLQHKEKVQNECLTEQIHEIYFQKMEGNNILSADQNCNDQIDDFEVQDNQIVEEISYKNLRIDSFFQQNKFIEFFKQNNWIKITFIKEQIGSYTKALLSKIDDALSECKKIQKPIRLQLEAHQISILFLVPLCKSLISFPNLVSLQLNLSKNYLNMNALQDLGQAIQLTRNVRFWDIDLSYNPKLDNIGHLILQDLSQLKQLEKLSVSLNNTSQNSQCALFAAKCVCNNKQTLRQINFQFRNCFQISDDSIRSLFNQIYEVELISSLGLGLDVIKINKQTSKKLSQILTKHQQMTNLTLNLSQCEINKRQFQSIAMSIYNMSSIKKLEFGCFSYKQNSFIQDTIGTILKNKYILDDLQLDLSDNSLEDDNLYELVQCLKNLPALKNVKFNLSKNQQFGKSVIHLANLLKEKEIKGSLDLRYCKIDQNIITKISNMLIMQLYLTQK
ncbi:elongation factor Ts protein (macronuclear) [Tetrahymena thermophila SB210]|uniref:Elongation factor Ts protein n=1 Tax=Tetrahymena thermophila (strain SB210) TaxID=312017 RepID=I7MI76_TETTS|nr:elongation factor Ts protein [Tetrahymena thermophila SB210]EAR90958.2 elongation factor Ts protein [Tetrahymena thermophila SB210]|eukprot:XP_001011203.2 elongation factor Ts protein [Tetrahymena thermophila SB210]